MGCKICSWGVGPIHAEGKETKEDLVYVLPRLSATSRDELPIELLEGGDEAGHRGISVFEQCGELQDRGLLGGRNGKS